VKNLRKYIVLGILLLFLMGTLAFEALSEVQVGVKSGDWIKYDYTVGGGWPAEQPHPEWLKVEFLTVEGTNATVRVTMHMSDGTEQTNTGSINIGAESQMMEFSGLIIPANSKIDDSVYITGFGNVTIEGTDTRTYAGASRTVVYASFSQYGSQLTYYWDKQTGVMVEASMSSGDVSATAKATETNIWEAGPSGFPLDPIYIIIIVVVVVAVVATVIILARRKKSEA